MKIFATPDLTEIPGLLIFRNNLIWFPTGSLISLNQAATDLRGIRFEANVVAARGLGGTEDRVPSRHIEFVRNEVASTSIEQGDASFKTFIELTGTVHDSPATLGIEHVDAGTGVLSIRKESPASHVRTSSAP